MKPWISFASRLFAVATSFVVLSVSPVVVYGMVALTRSGGIDMGADGSSTLTVPLLSALGAGAFSLFVAPTLSVAGQNWTQRFGWNAAMFPLLLGCGATVLLSLANGICGWNLTPGLILGGGLATSAAIGSFWAPLRWAQKILPRWDAKFGQLRSRLENRRPLAEPRFCRNEPSNIGT